MYCMGIWRGSHDPLVSFWLIIPVLCSLHTEHQMIQYQNIKTHTFIYRYILSVPTSKCHRPNKHEKENTGCWCEPRSNKSVPMAQAVSRQPLTAEVRVRPPSQSMWDCGGQSGTETGCSPRSSVFPCQYDSTLAVHTHISSGGWTIGLLVAAFRDIVSPHRYAHGINNIPLLPNPKSLRSVSFRQVLSWNSGGRLANISLLLQNVWLISGELQRLERVRMTYQLLETTLRLVQ
jgi:hypothetical protein